MESESVAKTVAEGTEVNSKTHWQSKDSANIKVRTKEPQKYTK